MTQVALGRDQYLYVNTGVKAGDGSGTWTEVGLSTDVNFNREKGEIDVTNRESARAGYTAMAQGLKAFAVEYDTHKAKRGQTPNPADALLDAAWEDNTDEEIIMANGPIDAGTDAPTTAYFAVINVGGGAEAQPLNEAVSKAVKLTNVGAPIKGYFLASTFTPGDTPAPV